MLLFLFVILAHGFSDIAIYDKSLSPLDCNQLIQQANRAHSINLSNNPTWKSWDDKLFAIFSDAIRRYVAPYPVLPPATKDIGYTLMRLTKENGTIHPFIDRDAIISAVLFLNEDVAGGEWWFPLQPTQTITPDCGRLVVFPSGYTHARGVKHIRLGEEWFIVTKFTS